MEILALKAKRKLSKKYIIWRKKATDLLRGETRARAGDRAAQKIYISSSCSVQSAAARTKRLAIRSMSTLRSITYFIRIFRCRSDISQLISQFHSDYQVVKNQYYGLALLLPDKAVMHNCGRSGLGHRSVPCYG